MLIFRCSKWAKTHCANLLSGGFEVAKRNGRKARTNNKVTITRKTHQVRSGQVCALSLLFRLRALVKACLNVCSQNTKQIMARPRNLEMV